MANAVLTDSTATRNGGGRRGKRMPTSGSIGRDEVVTKVEFMRRFGIGKEAWGTMLDQRMPVVKQAGMTFLVGAQFHDWMASRATTRP